MPSKPTRAFEALSALIASGNPIAIQVRDQLAWALDRNLTTLQEIEASPLQAIARTRGRIRYTLGRVGSGLRSAANLGVVDSRTHQAILKEYADLEARWETLGHQAKKLVFLYNYGVRLERVIFNNTPYHRPAGACGRTGFSPLAWTLTPAHQIWHTWNNLYTGLPLEVIK